MFVQSARTVAEHGQSPTERLARMNLAVHGLEGDIRQAITYYEDPHELLGRADFVMSSQASSAGGEAKISRRRLVETGDVDVVIAIRSNFFYTRTAPCELRFLNRAKPEARRSLPIGCSPKARRDRRRAGLQRRLPDLFHYVAGGCSRSVQGHRCGRHFWGSSWRR